MRIPEKINPIHQLNSGDFIDLDKVILVSRAYFIDLSKEGRLFVGYDIHCQLLKEPISYSRALKSGDEYRYDTSSGNDVLYSMIMVNGKSVPLEKISDESKILAVNELQKEVRSVVRVWKKRKKYVEYVDNKMKRDDI